MKRAFFETPQTVSWDRITKKLPNIFENLNKDIMLDRDGSPFLKNGPRR